MPDYYALAVDVLAPGADDLIREEVITEEDLPEGEDIYEAAVDLAERDAERVAEEVAMRCKEVTP